MDDHLQIVSSNLAESTTDSIVFPYSEFEYELHANKIMCLLILKFAIFFFSLAC